MNVLFVERSGNAKTGPIPVTFQPESTCPDVCPHKDKGCYARFNFVGKHWDRVNRGVVGESFRKILDKIRRLPEAAVWRYGVAGDLPGKGNRLAVKELERLVEANIGKRGFCFTHKPLTSGRVRQAIRSANDAGFTINLSADSLKEADQKASLGIGPVVVTLPEDREEWPRETPGGRRIVVCPAVTRDLTCKGCKLCTKPGRRSIVGFPAHGTGKKMVEEVYRIG